MTEATKRAIVAEFYKPASGPTRLFGLEVIEEVVAQHNGKTYLQRSIYDVDWSRTCGCYLFDLSGMGGDPHEPVNIAGLYLVSGDVEVKPGPAQWCGHQGKRSGPNSTKGIRKRNRTRRLQSPPIGIDLDPGQDLLDWLRDTGIEQNAVLCAVCKDWLPGDQLCEHMWWCDKIGWYSTPTEPCGHAREECEQ